MKKIALITLSSLFVIFVSWSQKKSVPPGELDLASMIQPTPTTAKFINDTSYIWCGTMVKSRVDQKYHLFYSRWPRKYGMAAWVTSSEVAHSVSDSPSVTQMPDSRFLMVCKAVAKQRPQPFGGPVVHLTAIADKPEGPFVKQNTPITAEDVDFPAEDPYVWYQDNTYYAIVKDMQGAFTDAGRSLVLFYSMDGLDWKLAAHPLVSDLSLLWDNGKKQKYIALERPHLFFEDGVMKALLVAVNETLEHSYNVQIPLKAPFESKDQ